MVEISFCTTCKDRLDHLSQTLPANLNIANGSPVEFVLLDYDSEEDVAGYVDSHLPEFISSGKLRYFRALNQRYFRMSHAKNVCHKMAAGKVVCNIDADTFITADLVDMLLSVFRAFPDTIARNCRGDGTIAVTKDNFIRLGGYDESFNGWGYEDNDFTLRAVQTLKLAPILHTFVERLEHLDSVRTRHMSEKEKAVSNEENKHRSEASRAAKRFEANSGRDWGRTRLLTFA